MPPNARRLAIFMDKNIQINEDERNWFFKINK